MAKVIFYFQSCPDDVDCRVYRSGCLVQLQQYDDALEDVNAALSTGFLQKGHTKNSLSKAYSIKGKQRNVNPKATFNKKINLKHIYDKNQ